MKPVVLHFIGAGRSGSTLLNIMLDNHPALMGTGELSFFVRAWLRGDYCSCERPLADCPFWQEVKNNWLQRTGMPNLETYWRLQQKYERYRRIPFVLVESKVRSPNYQLYQFYSAELYAAISEVSKATIIVDSSKNPVRAFALTTAQAIDLRLVFLIRDVRGYAWSKQKSFSKNQAAGLGRNVIPMSTWKSTIRWLLINLFSNWVCKRAKIFCLIRYEELVDNIGQAFSNISSLIEIDLSLLAKSICEGKAFPGSHIQAGNRLRMQKNIKLRSDESWQTKMPEKQKVISWGLAGRLMKRYGYSKIGNE